MVKLVLLFGLKNSSRFSMSADKGAEKNAADGKERKPDRWQPVALDGK